MDIMFKASCLLLLSLVLNVQLCSSLPIQSASSEQHGLEDPTPGAPIPIILVWASKDKAADKTGPQESAPEELTVPVEAAQQELDQQEQEEPAEDETAPEESALEDLIVIVPLYPAEEEAEVEEQVKEESIPLVSPDELDEETPEEYKEVEAVSLESAGVPDLIVPEENGEEDPATKEEPLPASDEPAPNDPILIIILEDLEEDAAQDSTKEESVQSYSLPKVTGLEEDTTPQKNETGDSEAEILVPSITETPFETETIDTVLDPVEEVPVAATDGHIATEMLTEAPTEPLTAPVPAVTEKIIPTPVDGGNGGSVNTTSEDFKAAVIWVEDEPVALVNRGTLLGAAFFTLMSFITIGFVWTTVSKKLR